MGLVVLLSLWFVELVGGYFGGVNWLVVDTRTWLQVFIVVLG